MKRKIIAIILAGGDGSRYNKKSLKQFEWLNQHPVLSYALDAFHRCEKIDEILLVVPPLMVEEAPELICAERWHKLRQPFIAGGKRRCDSCYKAVKFLGSHSDDDQVLIHDGARPLVTTRLIEECVLALHTHSAVSAALPVTDTLLEVAKETRIAKRKDFYHLQTPQGFSLGLLRTAYASFHQEGKQRAEPTDDISIALAYDRTIRVKLVAGERRNMKLTHPDDLPLLSFLAKH